MAGGIGGGGNSGLNSLEALVLVTGFGVVVVVAAVVVVDLGDVVVAFSVVVVLGSGVSGLSVVVVDVVVVITVVVFGGLRVVNNL